MQVEPRSDASTPRAGLRRFEVSHARGLAYGLLADLLARGVSDATYDVALKSPLLQRALTIYEGDREALSVDHEHAFGWAAPPFEGAYLDADGVVGGASAQTLLTLFGEAGFAPDLRTEEAEHLGTALRCLAFLSGAEADALEDGETLSAQHVEHLSRRLLDEHVLRYLFVWAAAVRRLGRAFPTALVDQIESLALLHRESIASAPSGFELPEAVPPIFEDDTGLREIAEHLASPARAGAFLSREDIAQLGRGARVPRGFGGRVQTLVNLLRSSAQYDAFLGLISAIDEELGRHERELDAACFEGVRSLIAPWCLRSRATRAMLEELRREAERAEAAG